MMIQEKAYSQVQYNQSMPRNEINNEQKQGLEQDLKNLLTIHGRLLNEVILANLNNASQNIFENIKGQLFENAREIGAVITSFSGSQAGRRFIELFEQHIMIGSQLFKALKANDQDLAKQIANHAIENAHMIARFFNENYPSIPYSVWKKLFDQHVMIEGEEGKEYFRGNFEQGKQLKDESLVQLREIAGVMTKALLTPHYFNDKM